MSEPSDGEPAAVGPSADPQRGAQDADRTAEDRDRTADARDAVSEARDEQAEARDERAEQRELLTDMEPGTPSDRGDAQRDRQGSAGDRDHANRDRQASSIDREMSARERHLFLVDGLTGARRRDAGLLELEREILRANRTRQTFVLVFVDVDGLKRINDAHGHTAGDELLAQIAATMRSHLRPYDLIVRYGGDEFLCGLMDLGLEQTSARFALVNAILTSEHHASVTAGVAELQPGDTLQNLIDRADAALYNERQRRAAPPGAPA
jgi:diguanylate cyclase (GGDEF)-like protein